MQILERKQPGLTYKWVDTDKRIELRSTTCAKEAEHRKVRLSRKPTAYILYLGNDMGIKDKSHVIQDLVGYTVTESSFNNSESFTKAWNSINKTANLVIIITHGNPDALQFEYGIPNMGTADILKLQPKIIRKLLLISCNAGFYEYRNRNPAAAFSKIIGGGKVLASDGTVIPDYPGWWFFQPNYLSYKSTTKDYYYEYFPGGAGSQYASTIKTNQGWIIYQNGYDPYVTGKKNLTISQMLELL